MPDVPLMTSYWPADTSRPILETTVGSVLCTAAARAADQIALIGGSPDAAGRRQWRFGELLADAERVARALLTRFEPGEPVAVWAGNVPEWVLLEFGAGLAGLTLVTVNPAYQAEELAHVLAHSRARGVFLAPHHRGRSLPAVLAQVRDRLPDLREVISLSEWDSFCALGGPERPLPTVDPGAPAQILYTSGTTGRPKAAALSHRAITNNARLALEAAGVLAGETAVNPMPLFHVAGATLLTLGFVQSLNAHVLMPYFDPGLQLQLIETYRSSMFGGVPTMLTALLEHPSITERDMSSLRYAQRRRDRARRAGAAGRVSVQNSVHHHLRPDRVELLDHRDQAQRHTSRPRRDPGQAAATDRGADRRSGHRRDRGAGRDR
jgi:acyl-CoA synthetase (AMP-forming)/AMP-acid ligase II